MPPQPVSLFRYMKLKNSGISGTNRSSTKLPTDNLKKKNWIGITIHKRIQKIKLAS
jgi:hypothetical protein